MQQPFDVNRLEVTGEATPVIEQVLYNPVVGRADFSVSATGVLAFRSSTNRSNQFAWFDRAGKLLETIGSPGNYRTPDLSPDGQRLAYGDVNQRESGSSICRDRLRHDSRAVPATRRRRCGFRTGARSPIAATRVACSKRMSPALGPSESCSKNTSTVPTRYPQTASGFCTSRSRWRESGRVRAADDGDRTPQAIVRRRFPTSNRNSRPDVRWLAYASSENGRNEIYVQAFPSTDGDGRSRAAAAVSRCGAPTARSCSSSATIDSFSRWTCPSEAGSFEYGVPQFLFEMRANVFNSRNSYIPSRDGKRFLVNMLLDADDAPINIVQHWQATVK